jgi:hypothetical protein
MNYFRWGDLIEQRHCNLKGETIRECMCLKSWRKSGFGDGMIVINE